MSSQSETTFRDSLEQKYGIKLPNLPTFLIWSIGLATVIALAVHDFVPLIKEYRENNVAVQVHVVLLDNQFQPPQLVLLLPRSKIRNKMGDDLMAMAISLHTNHGHCGDDVLEICQELKRLSLDVWNDRLQDFDNTSLENVYSNLTMAFIEKYLITLDTKAPIFPFDQYPLSGIIISSMMNYLEWICMTDYYFDTTSTVAAILFKLNPPPDFLQKVEYYDQKLDLLEKQTMEELCKRINYTELDYPDEFRDPVVSNRTCIDLLLHSSEFPVFLGPAGLWIPLLAADGPTTREYRFKTFPEKSNPLINSSIVADPFSPAFLYGDPGVLYQSAIDAVYSTYIFQTPVEKQNRGERIFVRYKVQMRARETRGTNHPCLNITSVTTCPIRCSKLWIMEKCKCISFNLKNGIAYPANDYPYCTPISYAKCNITELPKEVYDACMTKCQHPCGYTVYSWQISYESFEPLEDNSNELILKLIPTLDSFAEFTWFVKDTPEQFLAQIAGIGSFYLGFSGLSLFAVVIGLMEWWKRYKILRLEGAERMAHGEGQRDRKGWTMSDSTKGCRCDGGKCWREDKQWLMEIVAEIRTIYREDTEALIKEQLKQK